MNAKPEQLGYACPRVFWSGSYTWQSSDATIGFVIIASLLTVMWWGGWFPHSGGSFELGLKMLLLAGMGASSVWLIYSGIAKRSTQSEINEDGVCVNGELWPWSSVTKVWGEYDTYGFQVGPLSRKPKRVQIHVSMDGTLQSALLFSSDPTEEPRFRALMRELEEFLRADHPNVVIDYDPKLAS